MASGFRITAPTLIPWVFLLTISWATACPAQVVSYRMPTYAEEGQPPPRAQAEVDALLAGADKSASPDAVDAPPLRIVLVAGDKDHGRGEHDYPAWQKVWTPLLAKSPGVQVDSAWDFPTQKQIDNADVLVFYQRGRWDDARAAAIDPFLARGGGCVYIHWAVDGQGGQEEFAKRIGLASLGGSIKYRHGPLDVDFSPGAEHPIARNLERVKWVDESYWELTGDPSKLDLIATQEEDGLAATALLDCRAWSRPRVRVHPRPLHVDVRRPGVSPIAAPRNRLGGASQRRPLQRPGDARRPRQMIAVRPSTQIPQPRLPMHRRDFIAASAAATTVAATGAMSARGQASDQGRRYCEWRTYRLGDASKQSIVSKYLESAATPAWNRMGLEPVGVFREIGPDASPSLHVLLIFPTIEKVATERAALEADAEYQKNAVEYLAAQQDDPNFERIESSLLVAFAGMPQPKAPAKKLGVYELRTYESHNEERARKKIEMFDKYEITIFPECGFTNVFFGESLIGSGLPNLKYMLAAPDMATNEGGWKKFVIHPDWVAVRDLPEFKNTVSKIHKLFLEPLTFSQV